MKENLHISETDMLGYFLTEGLDLDLICDRVEHRTSSMIFRGFSVSLLVLRTLLLINLQNKMAEICWGHFKNQSLC